ncbi:MAG TPA: class I SAM-dependent methyltransferase [Patescibacteria group bacterium]|nr:class I SAM-dependent methyltransferase [Patescibacteria group bacterium]
MNVLDQCVVDGNQVVLPSIQLDRKLYLDINKVLETIGGKWNRKAKAHVFTEDPKELFDSVLLTGETVDAKKEYQFFPTPKDLARRMIEEADLYRDDPKELMGVLEPSAGDGAIADEVDGSRCLFRCCELNPKMAKVLEDKGYSVFAGDFLTLEDNTIQRIVMNPPFSKQQDIDHIRHAYDILQSGGILVSIVSESPFFRENTKSVDFREWLDSVHAYIEELPEGTFKESGTMVRARLIKIFKG